jgi:hypothetical protein
MAHADGFGWAKWRESVYSVKHPAPTAPTIADDLQLGAQKIWGEYRKAQQRWEHRAWKAWAVYAEAQQKAVANRRWTATAEPPVASSPGGSCYSIIAQAFGSRGLSVSTAYAIALRESNCNPGAQNSIGLPMGHASGLFQILYPGIWNMWAGTCGWGGSSPFNAVANSNVAACMVTHIGWGPWSLG